MTWSNQIVKTNTGSLVWLGHASGLETLLVLREHVPPRGDACPWRTASWAEGNAAQASTKIKDGAQWRHQEKL